MGGFLDTRLTTLGNKQLLIISCTSPTYSNRANTFYVMHEIQSLLYCLLKHLRPGIRFNQAIKGQFYSESSNQGIQKVALKGVQKTRNNR